MTETAIVVGIGAACPSSDDLRQRSVFGSEALAHRVRSLGGRQLMLQAAIGDGLTFDAVSFRQDGLAVSKIDVGGREVF